MKHKCTSWAIVATMERPDGTWYTDTITDIDDDTASSVDTFLTEYCEDKIINETVPHNDIKEANKNDTN